MSNVNVAVAVGASPFTAPDKLILPDPAVVPSYTLLFIFETEGVSLTLLISIFPLLDFSLDE